MPLILNQIRMNRTKTEGVSRQDEDLKINSEDGGGEWRPLREFSKSLSLSRL